MESTPESFCRSFKWGIDIRWSGKTGIHQMGDGRIAKLTLTTRSSRGHIPTSGCYVGFAIEIKSKQGGDIDSHRIDFDDHLVQAPGSRKHDCFIVIDHCGWKWYIMQPKSTSPFCQAVEAYINEWR